MPALYYILSGRQTTFFCCGDARTTKSQDCNLSQIHQTVKHKIRFTTIWEIWLELPQEMSLKCCHLLYVVHGRSKKVCVFWCLSKCCIVKKLNTLQYDTQKMHHWKVDKTEGHTKVYLRSYLTKFVNIVDFLKRENLKIKE